MTRTPVLAIVGGSLAPRQRSRLASPGTKVAWSSSTTKARDPTSGHRSRRVSAEPDSARVHPENFYAEHGIEIVVERATVLDPASRRIDLASGDVIAFAVAQSIWVRRPPVQAKVRGLGQLAVGLALVVVTARGCGCHETFATDEET